jgi:membrane-associated phospholipid phosphatase
VFDLHTPGILGRWPLIGLIMILLGGSVFGVVAINLLANSPLIQTDIQISNGLHELALQSSPFVIGVMIFGFYVGEHVIFAIGALLVIYYLARRYWTELAMVVIAWGGELAILFALSAYFHRPRPLYPVSVWRDMASPGFPSGHSISAVLCYGVLAYLIVPQIKSRLGKIAVIVAAIAIILFVGFSRAFVGDHYPADIIAGYGIGILWSGLVYTSVELVSQRMKGRQDLGGKTSALAQHT